MKKKPHCFSYRSYFILNLILELTKSGGKEHLVSPGQVVAQHGSSDDSAWRLAGPIIYSLKTAQLGEIDNNSSHDLLELI